MDDDFEAQYARGRVASAWVRTKVNMLQTEFLKERPMFNPTKAIEKLDEIGTHEIINDFGGNEKYNVSRERIFTASQVREIISAGIEDKPMTATEIQSRSKTLDNPLDPILYKTIEILMNSLSDRLDKLEAFRDCVDGKQKEVDPMRTEQENKEISDDFPECKEMVSIPRKLVESYLYTPSRESIHDLDCALKSALSKKA